MLTINKNLYFLRIINNRSQKSLGVDGGISQTHISRIENGIDFPTLNDVMFYSRIFDVSIDDLVYKEFNPETKKFE